MVRKEKIMAFRIKTFTDDCDKCHKMKADDSGQFICTWGNGRPKFLKQQKGKKSLKCKLKENK